MSDQKSARRSRREVLRAAGLMIGAAAASSLGPVRAKAASYPERPVKIIVSFAPGGPTDTMARILAVHLGDAIGGTVIVENKPGAGGNIGIGAVAHAEPDGHTLLITSSAYVVNPGLYAKIPYDPYKDFAPIAELGASPNAILVDPRLGVDSIAALIARAKANPDELNYASPGIGTTAHLSGELFKIVGGIQITHVSFSGAGHHRRSPLVRLVRCADHGRARLQGFYLRHVPGLSRPCEDAAGHRRAVIDQVDRNSEDACRRGAIAQQWLR